MSLNLTEPPAPVALHLQSICLQLGGQRLIGPLTATVQPGQCLTLMGPSGCGKSSLLAYLAGTLEPAFRAEGSVRLGPDDLTALPAERRRLGMLFQDDLLFPHLSVGANLAFALPATVRPMAQRRALIYAALAAAGLAGFAQRDPATLSGGQRARVAMLRTLAAQPRALLLDEPFSALDARLRDGFRQWVFAHARQQQLPTVLVTHDPDDARAAGGPVIVLGEG